EETDMDGIEFIKTTWQTLRHAGNSLRRQPGFAAIAILTVAVGVSVNTAMYTVVDATILRSLPFREPDRLLRISQVIPPVPGRPIPAEVAEDMVWSYPRYTAFREAQHSFVDLSVYRSAVFNLTNTEQPERLSGEIVSGSYFRVLGVEPEAGRTFLPEEDAVPERDFVVLLDHHARAKEIHGRRGSAPVLPKPQRSGRRMGPGPHTLGS
ncbi:MAG: hypothetical protein DMG09_24925, partial [Acidobacteria bacterium]